MFDINTHSAAYRRRRFLNWFPLGLSYAFLYMGRYNLTVAKSHLGHLMTKEDFGIIFGAGTVCYALSFLFNGPLVDRIGGRKGMLIGLAGSAVSNLAMGIYLRSMLAGSGEVDGGQLRVVFSALYAANMYFQSYGAVSIVKVNASWFHVEERGGFSGIFGTMISSGIFFAFTVNSWILDLLKARGMQAMQWVVFIAPALLLGAMCIVEFFLLRDSPSQAGQKDFDTGDASAGESNEPVPTMELFRRIFTNRIILIVAFIEFCTGVLRNGVMHWFDFYTKEVWVLEDTHILRYGSWERLWLVGLMLGIAAVTGFLASRAKGATRGYLAVISGLTFLAPFFQAGWGGLLFIAGVIGANVAGWVSQIFFQNRRAPAAGGLYFVLTICCVGMLFALGQPGSEVAWVAKPDPKAAPPAAGIDTLRVDDHIIAVAGTPVTGWADVGRAVACWAPEKCVESNWDADTCMCTTDTVPAVAGAPGPIPLTVMRGGLETTVTIADPKPVMRAGDKRVLPARPKLPISPYVLGTIVFLISLCVIGTHGLLSGTATMDFGGRKGAATAVGVIDGFVYLGTAVQSLSLGYLTTKDWSYWPMFLLPFAVIGTGLTLLIWNAKPKGRGGH